MQFASLPTLRALNRGKSAEAIKILKLAMPYELGDWALYPACDRGKEEREGRALLASRLQTRMAA
ncbi:MAG TPA: hypothetical protein VMG82_21505 [Candidatus Sulfotelmatobacter sp.]|nr:hypothetical protein [Candidatus Sulfotelmatobacter sp.]